MRYLLFSGLTFFWSSTALGVGCGSELYSSSVSASGSGASEGSGGAGQGGVASGGSGSEGGASGSGGEPAGAGGAGGGDLAGYFDCNGCKCNSATSACHIGYGGIDDGSSPPPPSDVKCEDIDDQANCSPIPEACQLNPTCECFVPKPDGTCQCSTNTGGILVECFYP